MPADILRGAPVAEALSENLKPRIRALAERGVTPCLGMIRIGEREGDLSYERSAAKRCGALGIAVRKVVLPADCSQEELLSVIDAMNRDASVHGILFFRPLPEGMDLRRVSDAIAPEKDVDGISSQSMAAVYAGLEHGFFPCTAQAGIEMLRSAASAPSSSGAAWSQAVPPRCCCWASTRPSRSATRARATSRASCPRPSSS